MELDRRQTRQKSKSKHRSRIQILAEILIISTGDGVNQTEIIIKAKLHYRQIKTYLDWLIATKLLETTMMQNKHVGYKITAKGYLLLDKLDNIQQLLQNPDYLYIVPAQPQQN